MVETATAFTETVSITHGQQENKRRDKRGKTNGVISYLDDATIDTTNFDITTPQYPGVASGVVIPQVPLISASINHLPPSWAVTYQWVRVDTAPPTFLEYITNDYQTDSDFIYLCIEALNYNNSKTGFFVNCKL